MRLVEELLSSSVLRSGLIVLSIETLPGFEQELGLSKRRGFNNVLLLPSLVLCNTFEAIKSIFKEARDSELSCKSIVLVFLLFSLEILFQSFECTKLQVSGMLILSELEHGFIIGVGANFKEHG